MRSMGEVGYVHLPISSLNGDGDALVEKPSNARLHGRRFKLQFKARELQPP
jgi:hypothetical protein